MTTCYSLNSYNTDHGGRVRTTFTEYIAIPWDVGRDVGKHVAFITKEKLTAINLENMDS